MMKNFTTQERQEIYEHLLTLQTPDLLAALIANRVDKKFIDFNRLDKTNLSSWVMEGFDWFFTPEEIPFWDAMYDSIFRDYMFAEEFELDFESPTEADFAPTETTGAKIEINVDVSKFNQEMGKFHKEFSKEIQPLSFWTKVKLFFGRLSYGI